MSSAPELRGEFANPLAADLNDVLEITLPLWSKLRNARLFVTGGTGFIGCWILESFAWANSRLGLDARLAVLTRNPDRFRAKSPHLAENPSISLVEGDVVSLSSLSVGNASYDILIHGAAESSARLNTEQPLTMIKTIVDGTREALAFASRRGVRRFLFLSSGAVYGRQPPEVDQLAEDYTGGPDLDSTSSAYAEAKRLAEIFCRCAARESAMEVVIDRCFAFLGPYLPLDRHFAVGNFVRDGLRGGPIHVRGDGTTCRTYLYAADLAIWLWTTLGRGAPGRVYNVGSEREVSIRELAEAVRSQFELRPEIHVASKTRAAGPPERYTPSTARAREELGLSERVGLEEGLRRTIAWHRAVESRS